MVSMGGVRRLLRRLSARPDTTSRSVPAAVLPPEEVLSILVEAGVQVERCLTSSVSDGGVMHALLYDPKEPFCNRTACGLVYKKYASSLHWMKLDQLDQDFLCHECDWFEVYIHSPRGLNKPSLPLRELFEARSELRSVVAGLPELPSAKDWERLVEVISESRITPEDPLWDAVRATVPGPTALALATTSLASELGACLPGPSRAEISAEMLVYTVQRSALWSGVEALCLGAPSDSPDWHVLVYGYTLDHLPSSVLQSLPYLFALLPLWEVAPGYHLFPADLFTRHAQYVLDSEPVAVVPPGTSVDAVKAATAIHDLDSGSEGLQRAVCAALLLEKV